MAGAAGPSEVGLEKPRFLGEECFTMAKSYYEDGLPYEDQSQLRAAIRSPWKKALAWYVNKSFNGGVCDLNRHVRRYFEPNPSATVLDVGTGDGDQFLWWAQQIGATRLHAMDAIPNRHQDRIQTTLTALDEAWPYADRFFDVVISSQNIEHIIDTPLYMKECLRVLKPGGYAIIMTENLASWANIGATVMGWMPFSFSNMFGYPLGNRLIWHEGLPKEDFTKFYERKLWGCLGHQRLFTPLALRQLGEHYGFRFEAAFGSAYLPLWGVLSEWFSRLDTTHAHFIGVKLRKPEDAAPHPGAL